MKSCMCTVYLMTKCSRNQPLQAYGVSPSMSNEELLAPPYIIMNIHSWWQSFGFPTASSYLKSKNQWEGDCCTPLLASFHPAAGEKVVWAPLSDGNFIETYNKEKEKKKPNEADVKVNEKHHKISLTEEVMLSLICSPVCTSTRCTCINSHKMPAPDYMPLISLLPLSAHLFFAFDSYSASTSHLYISLCLHPSLPPLSVWRREDAKDESPRCDVKQGYSHE